MYIGYNIYISTLVIFFGGGVLLIFNFILMKIRKTIYRILKKVKYEFSFKSIL